MSEKSSFISRFDHEKFELDMALPKKQRFRKITVEDEEFYWRFENVNIDNQEASILIGLIDNPNKRFRLKFAYIDKLDILGLENYFGKEKYTELINFKNEIDIIKPSHVADAIKTALKDSFLKSGYKQEFIIRLENGLFYKE